MPTIVRGKVLSYDDETGAGVIEDHRGMRHDFATADWTLPGSPEVGVPVGFEPREGGGVHRIYAEAAVAAKSRLLAGVLAVFLGAVGLHKFYLGYALSGIVLLLLTVAGWITVAGPIVAGAVGLVEGIIYLTRSDREFADRYVIGHRAWF